MGHGNGGGVSGQVFGLVIGTLGLGQGVDISISNDASIQYPFPDNDTTPWVHSDLSQSKEFNRST